MANSQSNQGQLNRSGVKRLISDKRGKRGKLRASRIRESYQHVFTEKGTNEQTKDGKKNRVYLVTIIEVGLGNSKDKNYYSEEAITKAPQVFNGAKAYADHPDAISEKTLPERSMKDLVGWYTDCFVDTNTETGKKRLRGKLHMFQDAKWLSDKIDTILTDPTAKDLFGISINAVGKTRPAQMEGEEVNYVEGFQRVDSADVVTEPAARGKFDKMLESRRSSAGKHSTKVSKSSMKRTRESGVLSPEKAKEVADSLVSAYNSDNPDELKQATFEASKVLHAASSISGKGPGQVNEEQYSNISPTGGNDDMAKRGVKVKASVGGGRLRKRKRTFASEAAGTGPDNEDEGEPDPADIENELEESDVEDEEGRGDLGDQGNFGGGSKYRSVKASAGARKVVRRGRTREDEGLEDEGFEDEDEDGALPGAGMAAPAGGGAPGSSRTVASAEADDDDEDDFDDDDEMDESEESIEDEDESLEDESMEDEDEDEHDMMRPGTVAESRRSGNPRRRGTREADGSSQGGQIKKASYAGGLGHSGHSALPKGADPDRGYEDSDEDWGKKDDSTSGVGKSYKIKTSKYSRNRAAKRVAKEANRRIEKLEGRIHRLRESRRSLENELGRYKGIIRFQESRKRAVRLLREAVNEQLLPEEFLEDKNMISRLARLTESRQIQEIKHTARLLESAQEGTLSRLSESVEGSGARGGAVSFRTAEAEDSELASGLAEFGVPMKK